MLHTQLLTAVLALISFPLVAATTSAPTSGPTSQYIFFATFSNYATSDFDSTSTTGVSLRSAYISTVANLSSVTTEYVTILGVEDERRSSGGTTVECQALCTAETQSDLPSLMYDATATGFGKTFVAAAAGLGVTVDTPTMTHYAVWAEPTDGSGSDDQDSCGTICIVLIIVFSVLAFCCCLLAAAGWYYMRGYVIEKSNDGEKDDEPIDESFNFASFRTPAGEWAGLSSPTNHSIEHELEELEEGDLASPKHTSGTSHWAQNKNEPSFPPQMQHHTNDLVLNLDGPCSRASMPQYHDSGDAAAEGSEQETVTKANLPEADLQKMRETVMAPVSESDHSDDRDAAPATDAIESPPQKQAKQKGFRGSYDAPAQAEKNDHQSPIEIGGQESQPLSKYPLGVSDGVTRTMSI